MIITDSPIIDKDFYKFGHPFQYPTDVTHIFSNCTPRYCIDGKFDHMVTFGLQYFIKSQLIERFKTHFFDLPIKELARQYKQIASECLGDHEFSTAHIEKLHSLQYLPMKFYALPEGSAVPYGVPTMVMTNTHPDFGWLPNMFETMLSNVLWMANNSATIAQGYRKLFVDYAKKTGITDPNAINFMGHDFSYRGLPGREAAIVSGMGHLLSFDGTDTVPSILKAKQYYRAELNCGQSVPATEHSVMCAGSKESETETFSRLLDIYPKGPLSIVSDTWNLWKVILETVFELKDKILNRDGVLVIRPDSGDPVNIVCGEDLLVGKIIGNDYTNYEGYTYNGSELPLHPRYYGVVELLEWVLGGTKTPHGIVLNKSACIYGDSITLERAEKILEGLTTKGYSILNMVFGIGSYTYQYQTRDNHGQAMKATGMKRRGSDLVIPLFKKPITDKGGKNSHYGIPTVYGESGKYTVKQESAESDLDNCAFRLIYKDGELLVDDTFSAIRERVRSYVQ